MGDDMTLPVGIPAARTRLWYSLFLTTAVFAIIIMALGCGGGISSNSVAHATLWQQQGATYVGKLACRECHANTYDQYAQQPMGNFTSNADSRHTGSNCGACHVTGFGEPTGGKLDGSTPQLDGIGCESCHGPGSKHIAANTTADRKKQITRVPPDKTCINCHGDRKSTADGYRPGAMDEPYTPVTSADLRSTAPGSVRGPHHPAAAFLFGWKGYNYAEPLPSPHSTMPNTCQNCHQKNIAPNGKVDHGEDAQEPNTDTSRAECASCHGGSRDTDHLVQAGINKLLIELGGESSANPGTYDSSTAGGLLGAYATAHNIDLKTNNDPDNPNVIAYKAARHNIRYVISDGSMGVHNPEFAKQLLEKAKELLSE